MPIPNHRVDVDNILSSERENNIWQLIARQITQTIYKTNISSAMNESQITEIVTSSLYVFEKLYKNN